MRTQSTGVGELYLSPGHSAVHPRRPEGSARWLAEKAHCSALCEGPSLCSEPGMRQGGGWFLEHALEQCGLQSARFSVSSGSLRLCSLPLSANNLLPMCKCACVLSLPTGGFGGDHLATTATISLWQLSPQIGRTLRGRSHLWFADTVEPARLLKQLRSPFRVGSTVMAVPSAYKDQLRASVPVLLAIFYQQLSFILSSCFPFFLFKKKKQITAGLLRLQWNTQSPRNESGRQENIVILLIRNQQTRTSLYRDF